MPRGDHPGGEPQIDVVLDPNLSLRRRYMRAVDSFNELRSSSLVAAPERRSWVRPAILQFSPGLVSNCRIAGLTQEFCNSRPDWFRGSTRRLKLQNCRPDPDLHFISKPNDRVLRFHPRPPTSFAPAMKKRYKTQYYSISRECPMKRTTLFAAGVVVFLTSLGLAFQA